MHEKNNSLHEADFVEEPDPLMALCDSDLRSENRPEAISVHPSELLRKVLRNGRLSRERAVAFGQQLEETMRQREAAELNRRFDRISNRSGR